MMTGADEQLADGTCRGTAVGGGRGGGCVGRVRACSRRRKGKEEAAGEMAGNGWQAGTWSTDAVGTVICGTSTGSACMD